MALSSIQPLKEMSTKDISWGVKAAGVPGISPGSRGDRCLELTNLPPSGVNSLDILGA
jgi:hypothetical protein